MVEPRNLNGHGRALAQLYQSQHALPYNLLEGGFLNLSTAEATVAYDESLAAVLYMQDTYGMSDIQRILQRLGEGSSPEAALRSTIHSGYRELEAEVGKYLANRYGS